MNFKFYAHGHPSVSSTHPTTLELTRDTDLGKNGDCIVAAGCSVGLVDLPEPMKNALSSGAGRARLTLTVGINQLVVEGRGAHGLNFSYPSAIGLRKIVLIPARTWLVSAGRKPAE